jgi:hypothetical protein
MLPLPEPETERPLAEWAVAVGTIVYRKTADRLASG